MRPSFPYDEQSRFKRVFPHALGTPPEELTDRIDFLSEQIEQLGEEDDDTDELATLQSELAELESELATYHGLSAADRAVAGCVVTLGYRDVEIYEGLLRPGQKAPSAYSEADTSPQTPKPRYRERLRERLMNYRLHAVRLAVAEHYETAFDALVYALSCREFAHTNCRWIGVTANSYDYPPTLLIDGAYLRMKWPSR